MNKYNDIPDENKIMTDCVICLKKYEENDDILELKCDHRHYFHKECLEEWVKTNHDTCPLCTSKIVVDNLLRRLNLFYSII